MKLSDAIRLGAMALPPVYGPLIAKDRNDQPCGACVLGAALFAAGWPENNRSSQDLFPLLSMTVTAPDDRVALRDVHSIIIVLFECYDWTRERIADWVATIEASAESADTTPHHEDVRVGVRA